MSKQHGTEAPRFTSADLQYFPDDGKRYEIIDGELYVSRQPHYFHQETCSAFCFSLNSWSDRTGNGRAVQTPGLIFAEDDDVAPDVIWSSSSRLSAILGSDGKLHGAPELIIEVLSPGVSNENRDRDAKLKLYSRRGVDEYWIADWRGRLIEVYRRNDARLELVATLKEGDSLNSPLLPGFACPVSDIFAKIPADA